MKFNDIMGTIGVGLILIAYFLNTAGMIIRNGVFFFIMNILGAAISCYASWLLNYWPFIILEGIWTLVSIYGLIKVINTSHTEH